MRLQGTPATRGTGPQLGGLPYGEAHLDPRICSANVTH